MPTTTYHLAREDTDVFLAVTYRTVRASGDGWYEPREPAHVELDGWTPDIELTDKEIEEIEQAIIDSQPDEPDWPDD